MAEIIDLRAYRQMKLSAKAKPYGAKPYEADPVLENIARLWVDYWFILAGLNNKPSP